MAAAHEGVVGDMDLPLAVDGCLEDVPDCSCAAARKNWPTAKKEQLTRMMAARNEVSVPTA